MLIELCDLWHIFSVLAGNWNRVVFSFNIVLRGAFSDDTGVENNTWALFGSLAGASSSDRDLQFQQTRNHHKLNRKTRFKDAGYGVKCYTNLIFKTPLSGDLDFLRFGVLLPMSIMSISCVRPVLPEHPSSARLSIWWDLFLSLIWGKQTISIESSATLDCLYSEMQTNLYAQQLFDTLTGSIPVAWKTVWLGTVPMATHSSSNHSYRYWNCWDPLSAECVTDSRISRWPIIHSECSMTESMRCRNLRFPSNAVGTSFSEIAILMGHF